MNSFLIFLSKLDRKTVNFSQKNDETKPLIYKILDNFSNITLY